MYITIFMYFRICNTENYLLNNIYGYAWYEYNYATFYHLQ